MSGRRLPPHRFTKRMAASLAAHGFLARRAVRLSRAGDAPLFRLDLADGGRAKVRFFRTADAARQVWRLLERAPEGILAPPLLRLGRAIVTEYAEGVPLDRYLRTAAAREGPRIAESTARLLARLHARPVARAGALTPPAYRRLLARAIGRLERRRLLDAAAAARLVRLRTRSSARCVLTHGDVCPDNIVLTARGPRIIDEERVAARPVAFELARVVVRWPLDAAAETRFLAAYRRAGGDDRGFRADREFWIAVALASSAAYRLRRRLPGVKKAATALRAIARGL